VRNKIIEKASFAFIESHQTYRIKITGFQKKLTSQILAQLLEYEHEKQCYVNRFQNQIG